MRALAIAVVTAAVLPGCGLPRLVAIPAERAAALPALEVQILDGAAWSTRDAAGRVIVLDVWATYCAPCKKAFPKLTRLAAAYPDVTVVGFSADDDEDAVRSFLREVPAGFHVARIGEHMAGAPPLSITKLPTLIVVDKRGRVRLRAEELVEGDYDGLPALIEALRAE